MGFRWKRQQNSIAFCLLGLQRETSLAKSSQVGRPMAITTRNNGISSEPVAEPLTLFNIHGSGCRSTTRRFVLHVGHRSIHTDHVQPSENSNMSCSAVISLPHGNAAHCLFLNA